MGGCEWGAQGNAGAGEPRDAELDSTEGKVRAATSCGADRRRTRAPVPGSQPSRSRAQPPDSRAGGAACWGCFGRAGQGCKRPGSGRGRAQPPGRAPGGDDLGATPQARDHPGVSPLAAVGSQASAGQRLRSQGDTVRIAATASRVGSRRRAGDRDFGHRGFQRGSPSTRDHATSMRHSLWLTAAVHLAFVAEYPRVGHRSTPCRRARIHRSARSPS